MHDSERAQTTNLRTNSESIPKTSGCVDLQEDPDRRMTRAEWEREESLARQAAHKKHEQVRHDREVQQEYDRRNTQEHRNWGKILLWVGVGSVVLLLIFLVGYLPHHARNKKAAAAGASSASRRSHRWR